MNPYKDGVLTTTEVDMSETGGTEKEPELRRFWIRAFSCILAPPALAAYYVWTYVYFLQPSGPIAGSVATAVDGRLVWWSWFVIGAIGLNVSTYVLAGVEAGMLTTRRFGTLSTDQIVMHKDQSWGKISGWAHAVRHVFRQRWPMAKSDGAGPVLSLTWVPLFLLSVLSWAFALSGLTMEARPTFKTGVLLTARVVGANATNFDRRSTLDIAEAAYQLWQRDLEPRVPLVGAVYLTPDGGMLGNFNMTEGNKLPPDTANTTIFLAPQAEIPTTGTAWGLAVRYSCRPIHNMADFRILSKRFNSKTLGYLNGTDKYYEFDEHLPVYKYSLPPHYFYEVLGGDGATISVIRDSESLNGLGDSVAEVGISGGLYNVIDPRTRSYSSPNKGLDEEDLLEIALWQGVSVEKPVKDGIPELDREYSYWFLSIDSVILIHMSAIGVQCVSASSTGNASVDGIVGTFADFARQDPIGISDGHGGEFYTWSVSRLGNLVPAMFLPGICGSSAFDALGGGAQEYGFPSLRRNFSWVPDDIAYMYVEAEKIFKPRSNSWILALATAGNVLLGAPDDGNVTWNTFARRVEPEDLQRALQNAHRHAAVGLMYTQNDEGTPSWEAAGLISAIPWTTLGPPQGASGSVPAILVLVMLVVWAAGCVVLGFLYSFRKRWDAFFNVRSLYWYCRVKAERDPVEVMKAGG